MVEYRYVFSHWQRWARGRRMNIANKVDEVVVKYTVPVIQSLPLPPHVSDPLNKPAKSYPDEMVPST